MQRDLRDRSAPNEPTHAPASPAQAPTRAEVIAMTPHRPLDSLVPTLSQFGLRQWLLFALGLLLLVVLLQWWRSRRRARRVALRVWNPNHASRLAAAPGITAKLPEEALATPDWLTSATTQGAAPAPASAPIGVAATGEAQARTPGRLAQTAGAVAPLAAIRASTPAAAPPSERDGDTERPHPTQHAPTARDPDIAASPSASTPAPLNDADLVATPIAARPILAATPIVAASPIVAATPVDDAPTAALAPPLGEDEAPTAPLAATLPAPATATPPHQAPVAVAAALAPTRHSDPAMSLRYAVPGPALAPQASPPVTLLLNGIVLASTVPAPGNASNDTPHVSPYLQARRLAAQDRPLDAWEVLRPSLNAQSPATAWAMAGWCAWKLARGTEQPQAWATEAADAFSRALAADPSRGPLIGRMIGRCHRLLADVDAPAQRSAHLVAAAQAYANAFRHAGTPSDGALREWADVLLTLAHGAAPAERTPVLTQLDAVLAQGPQAASASTAWYRLRAQAALLHATAASSSAERTRHRREAVELMQLGHARIQDAAARDHWLADSIDAERRHLGTLSQAARDGAFRAMAERVRPALETAQSSAPWLAWVHVLADWSRPLQDPAARPHLAEAGKVFVRLQALPAADEEEARGIAFAQAYYLRLRAEREPEGSRAEWLDRADALLAPLRVAEFPELAAVALEQTEIALARTRLAGDATPWFEQAVAHATFAADLPQTRVPGFRLLLGALLAWQQHSPAASRLQQIALVAQWLQQADTSPTSDTWCLLAMAALTGGHAAQAAQLSASAWEAGAARSQVLSGWQRADALWARDLPTAAEQAAWQRQHRLLRLASSTT